MDFGFVRAHGYSIEKGYICNCESKEDAIEKINKGEYSDITDEDDTESLTIGYEVVDIWELD